MNWTDDTRKCVERTQAAAYVLAALEPDENERYQQHLRECAACRADVARLQPVADALPAATPPERPPKELRERIMSQVRAEAELLQAAGPSADVPPARSRRRPRRIASIAGAAALACAVAVGALLLGGGTGGTSERVIQASVLGTAPGARAEIRQSGPRVELIVSGLPQPPLGETYEVWLTKPGQAPQPTNALFSVDRTGDASIDVPGNLQGVERLMVTTEPLGGSRHPTTPAVIRATL